MTPPPFAPLGPGAARPADVLLGYAGAATNDMDDGASEARNVDESGEPGAQKTSESDVANVIDGAIRFAGG